MLIDIENKEALYTYITQNKYLKKEAIAGMEILKGGVSNRTVWLQVRGGPDWVLKQALPKLRVKEDWFSEPRRIQLEALGIKWLSKFSSKGSITPFVFLDKANHILAMEAVPKPHANFKILLLNGEIDLNHFKQFGTLLGTTHSKAATTEEDIKKVFNDRSFFESLRLEPYYEFTATRLPEARPFLHQLCGECRTHRYTLVHGDYSPKNILVYQGKLILLDHEVIHYGDGTFDIGFSLCHLLSKINHLSDYRPILFLGAKTYWQSYLTANTNWTSNLEERAISHTLACLLARVHGRSPLEYLSKKSQEIQTKLALHLIQNRPTSVEALIEAFYKKVEHAQH